MENNNIPNSNCTIEEHMALIHGPNGASMTTAQIVQQLSCSIPADRWVDLEDHLIEYVEQKETVLLPVAVNQSAELVQDEQPSLKPSGFSPQLIA